MLEGDEDESVPEIIPLRDMPALVHRLNMATDMYVFQKQLRNYTSVERLKEALKLLRVWTMAVNSCRDEGMRVVCSEGVDFFKVEVGTNVKYVSRWD